MQKDFTIIIIDTAEAPFKTTLTSTSGQQSYPDDSPTINENSAIGTPVGTFVSLDQDAMQHLSFYLDNDTGRNYRL